jgi:pimeloyl-ACP methyl ester carboxylesterase
MSDAHALSSHVPDIAQYIQDIEVQSLKGRMMRMPASNSQAKREIILMYGQHASLERMSGIAEVLTQYGRVTVPDLPGFGGMPSFYTVGAKPTLENFAEYLADFIAKEYPKDAKLTIVAMSFSFLVVTRMLQLHPELVPRVAMQVSFVGFLHHDDFHVARPLYWLWRTLAFVSGGVVGAAVWKHFILQPIFIRTAYTIVAKIHPKMKGASKEERTKRINFEIKLWHINDFRTRMHTLTTMLTSDVCSAKIDLPVYHVSVAGDFYFDNTVVERHMRQVYNDFEAIPAAVTAHAPTIVATAEEAAPFIPPRLRQLLEA